MQFPTLQQALSSSWGHKPFQKLSQAALPTARAANHQQVVAAQGRRTNGQETQTLTGQFQQAPLRLPPQGAESSSPPRSPSKIRFLAAGSQGPVQSKQALGQVLSHIEVLGGKMSQSAQVPQPPNFF